MFSAGLSPVDLTLHRCLVYLAQQLGKTITKKYTSLLINCHSSNTCRQRKLKCLLDLLTPLAQDCVDCSGDEQLPICSNCVRGKRYCDHIRQIRFRNRSPKNDDCLSLRSEAITSLGDQETARLFHHYSRNLASWYDLSDANDSFAKLVPLEALTRPLVLNAVLAFAAIHLSQTNAPAMRPTAEKFHAQCVKLLISLKEDDVNHENGCALAAICLLRSYEILSEDLDPNRHLTGAYALAASGSLDIYQPSLARAGFFNYLREDITFSLLYRCPLKIDVSNTVTIPGSAQDDEDQLNIASLFLADVINRVFGNCGEVSGMDQSLMEWKASLPVQFTPYFETPQGQATSSFPTIRLLRDCHVSVVQYYLTATNVLCSRSEKYKTVGDELHENALRICGLAFSAGSTAVMVNSFGPISFSCRYLQSEALRTDLRRRLLASQKDTGWPVQRIIDDLEGYWTLQELGQVDT